MNDLLKRALYYPELRVRTFCALGMDHMQLSTIVRLERGGVWYIILVQSDTIVYSSFDIRQAYLELHKQAYRDVFLYVVGKDDIKDPCQLCESERLKMGLISPWDQWDGINIKI